MSTAPAGRRHRLVRPVVTIGLLGFAVHILLPQVGQLQQAIRSLQTGRWPFLAVSLLGSGLAFTASAWMVRASVFPPPPWARTVAIQVAASFSSAVTPAGLGSVAVNASYLQSQGLDEGTARTATALNMVLTFVSHVGLLVVLVPLLPTLRLPVVHLPSSQLVVDAVAVVALAVGIVLWLPVSRRRALVAVVPVLEAIPAVLGDRRRSLTMAVAAVATNLAYAVALAGSIAAFGASAPLPGILIVYLTGASIGAISPTPGGLGATEAALVAGMTRLGVPGGKAVAGVLAFRLATFWLPLLIGAWLLRRARRLGWA